MKVTGLFSRAHRQRYREVLSVLAKYGFDEALSLPQISRYTFTHRLKPDSEISSLSRPERVRLMLEELGGAFVKAGQLLSNRPDLIPEELMVELEKLQDTVPPFPGETAIAVIESELDGPLIFTPFHLPELPSLKELKELGIACSWVIGIMEASMIAAWDFAHDFRNRDAEAMRDFEKRTAGHQLAGAVAYHGLVGWEEVAKLEEKYLPEQLKPKYDETIGSFDPRQKN